MARYVGAWRTLNAIPHTNVDLTGSVPAINHSTMASEQPLGIQQTSPPLLFPSQDNGVYVTDYVTSIGPVSTEPLSHAYGMGTDAALPANVARSVDVASHSTDYGTVAERRTLTPVTRDGNYSTTVTEQPPTPVGSMASVALQNTSSPEVSPNARHAKATVRTFDRPFMRRVLGVNYRPMRVSTAYSAPSSPAVVDGNQYTSPFPTAVGNTVNNMTVIAPQTREVPSPQTFDSVQITTADYGFFNGGL
jgi:hypothetical protein